ncbi:MAG TPA: hypothetical protein VJK54_04635, partial [Chthoniobacterales bacterium]|nr:hypothetical protein [Chthoniobacterales bacterium]
DALDSAKFFEAVDASNTKLLEDLKDHPTWYSNAQKENITWSVQSARETADFVHAVVAFKKNQEAAIVEDRRWKMEDRENVEDGRDGRWKMEDGKNREEEAAKEQNRRIEQGKLAEVKALAESPCEDWSAKGDRANAIMKMTREKFGSPVSAAMKEFIAHPSEATLRATGKSSVIAMTPDEADEAVETAEIFAKIAADAAKLGRDKNINAALQENCNWSETITREIVEFARAVATFKAAQQP